MVESLRNVLDTLGVDWVLWLLLGMSVLGLAVIIERAVYFRRNHAPLAVVERHLVDGLGAEGPEGALRRLEGVAGMEAAVARDALRAWDRGPDVVDEVVAGAIERERIADERLLPILGTLGANAPFVGLFGTVVGVVSAFHDLEVAMTRGDTTRNEALMGSISEALVATAIGLLVAIPAVVAFNYFKARVRVRVAGAQAAGRIVVAHLRVHGRQAPRVRREVG